MLGCARGGWAVSRALGGLYGGRVSCHGSIMYGHAQPCAPARQVSLVGGRAPLSSAGWVVGRSRQSVPGRVGVSAVLW